MAFLDPANCRAVLASTLAAIAGVTRVYPRRRVALNEQAVQALFTDPATGKINTWMVSFAVANPVTNDKKMGFAAIGTPGSGMVMSTFRFQIEGYFGLDDANDSSEIFDTLVWTIAQTLNSYGKLAIDGLVTQWPCDVQQITFAMLANKFLTHYAKLVIPMEGRTQ